MALANQVSPPAGVVEDIHRLLAEAFAEPRPNISKIFDINEGRGVFSAVYRIELQWPNNDAVHKQQRPQSVVAKLPCEGENRTAAKSSGAYARELAAYSELLVGSHVGRPKYYAGLAYGDGTTGLLLEDLTSHRAVDQIEGLNSDDALAVADALAQFHREWGSEKALATDVRRSIVGALSEASLTSGLKLLETDWADHVNAPIRSSYSSLLQVRGQLIDLFLSAGNAPTLCHGDPRADNLVFNRKGKAVLFDWQQVAVQFGEADLAWLAGTSLSEDVRRTAERELVNSYGGDFDRYRLGFALPGLAVLMLAQRQLQTPREIEFVAMSLRRIGQALLDLEVSALTR